VKHVPFTKLHEAGTIFHTHGLTTVKIRWELVHHTTHDDDIRRKLLAELSTHKALWKRGWRRRDVRAC